MIISKLQGGLGNQLFQYSIGRSLALKHKVPLKLDTTWYGVVPDRQYDLGHFNIQASLASPAEIRKLKGVIPDRIKRLTGLKHPQSVIMEPSLAFHPEVLEAGPDIYLEGYWQSEKYFTNIADVLKKELQVIDPLTGLNAELLEQIQKTDAISLHVRRGDYVTNTTANKFHGTCSPEYYEAAIKMVTKKVQKPHLYIFSDDSEWIKENMKYDFPTTYIDHNSKAGQEDLRLMSNCKHFIVANSTFSWWGAWLSQSPQKMVIAPKQWFQGDRDSSDLVPESWIRI